MRESNSHQRFWRPLSYHLTNPLSKPTCKISFTVAIIHIKATIVKLIVHFYYKEFYKERAEMEGFEPSHRLPGLPHFECGPFSHLGTSPWCYESADSLFIILPCFSSVNTRFCRFLISRSSLKNPLSIWEHSSCKTPRVTST